MSGAKDLYLAPVPKKLSAKQGEFDTKGKNYIQLVADDTQSIIPAALKTELEWEITASPKAPKDEVGLVIKLDYGADIQAEGYKLTVKPDVIEILASTPAGAFYGACTLAQILRQCDGQIPCLTINDWPDYPDRGVMLDISRDKVPNMETLYHLVDLMADWKINQFQLYTEHTFAYLAHEKVWEHASPMTGEEILALDAYCKSQFIELVPNQNSFGHMDRWLKHDEYLPMAEAPNGCDTEWGHFDYPFSLCPGDKRSLPFIKGLFDELLPHFSSSLFNVGCDETVDLGRDRSEKVCEEKGRGRVYLDFLLEIHKFVKEHGRTMMFWGDIVLRHPELIPEIPKDIIALEWGYENGRDWKGNCEKFAAAGLPFYVCPGTSSWNALVGRGENAIGNIVGGAREGLKHGATGLLNTEWGDNGHWQPLATTYLGLMVGAMASWNTNADVKDGLAETYSLHAFGDRTGVTGKAWYDLSDIYLMFKKKTGNNSVPWQMLFRPIDDKSVIEGIEMSELEEMEKRINEIDEGFFRDKMTFEDADIVCKEFEYAISMLQLSVDVGKMRLGAAKPKNFAAKVKALKEKHDDVWLLRNRPGGMEDSANKLKLEKRKSGNTYEFV
ncbi:MAG: glycoside hydrolase family 20 zincin-like fold domain-containing protein [Armatimonadota bacterium]